MRQTFQERVLAKIAAKRERRRAYARVGFWLLCFAVGTGMSAYKEHRRAKAPAEVVLPTPATWRYVNGDGMPLTLVINGEIWSLSPAERFQHKEWLAVTFCENRTIYYLALTTPREEWRDDIMHEIFHAGACAHGGATWWNSAKEDPIEHRGIYHLGTFTAQLLHDNPELMAWVAK